MSERAKVKALRVRNVKCIREVSISLEGEIEEIRGEVGQGKTGILRSIESALRGIDPDLIRKGSGKAEVELELDQGIIQRVLSEDGKEKSLLVKTPDGKAMPEAKAFLRSLCGGGDVFRPIAWVQLGGVEGKGRKEAQRRQRNMLLSAIDGPLTKSEIAKAIKNLGAEHVDAFREINIADVDLDQNGSRVCEEMHALCYERRALLNAQKEECAREMEKWPAPPVAAPAQSLEECQKLLNLARSNFYQADAVVRNRSNVATRRFELHALIANMEEPPSVDIIQQAQGRGEKAREEINATIARLESELEAARQRSGEIERGMAKLESDARNRALYDARVADLAKMDEELSGETEVPDLDALREAMHEAEADVTHREMQDRHDAAAAKALESARKSEVFTELVTLFRDALPSMLLARANLPLDGLAIEDETIVIHGVPLHELGTSEQIRVGVVIASALNPLAGFVLVDQAESLGREGKKALAAVAHELGLQLIMTVVDPDAVPGPGVTVMRAGQALTN
jgi:DNA repair ATPase RecN